MQSLIVQAAPRYVRAVRVHVGGDFFSQDYFDAWMGAAREIPTVRFYAYTKSLKFWVARLGQIPSNFSLIASFGGRHDALIEKHDLPKAVVVFHPDDAEALNLRVDKNEELAIAGKSLALVVHGTQPAGSPAATALKEMRKQEIVYSYRRRDVVAADLVEA